VLRPDATRVKVRVEIALDNDGERQARETVINVLAPRYLENFGGRGRTEKTFSRRVLPARRPAARR